jgi:hypothetical protein
MAYGTFVKKSEEGSSSPAGTKSQRQITGEKKQCI